MKNELQKHKKSDKIKWVFTGVGFTLIFVILFGMCLQLFGAGKVKPSEWFKNSDTEKVQPTETGKRFAPLSDKFESGIMPLSADPDSTTLTFNSDVYPFTVVTHYEDYGSGADYDNLHTIKNSSTSVYLYSDWDAAYESYEYLVDIYLGDHMRPAYCSVNYTHYEAGSRSSVVVEVQFNHEHTYSWVQTIAPTEESEGQESYKCSVCGYVTETRTLPRLATPVELPEDPVREGYTFVGWYYDEACTQPYDGQPIYADTALYAGWQINTFTVTFVSVYGESTTKTVDWNTAAELHVPELRGHNFLGWFMSDGETEYIDQPITSDITLTARWERVKCTVTFYVGGVFYTTLTVDYGTPLIEAAVVAGLFADDIISYGNLNGEEVTSELAAVTVTSDMTVSANEPNPVEKAVGYVNNNWKSIVMGAGGMLGLVAFAAVIIGLVKRKKR